MFVGWGCDGANGAIRQFGRGGGADTSLLEGRLVMIIKHISCDISRDDFRSVRSARCDRGMADQLVEG